MGCQADGGDSDRVEGCITHSIQSPVRALFSMKRWCILGRSRDRTDTILRPLFVQQGELREFTSNSTRFSNKQQASMRVVFSFLRAGATISIALRI